VLRASGKSTLFAGGRDGGGEGRERFDQVVNALWNGRLALNEAVGLKTGRAWIHRLKYGVSFRYPKSATRPRSATFILGPFGEVVNYRDGLTHLTWYPTCLRELSRESRRPIGRHTRASRCAPK